MNCCTTTMAERLRLATLVEVSVICVYMCKLCWEIAHKCQHTVQPELFLLFFLHCVRTCAVDIVNTGCRY